jgi:hypothetical protein
MLQKLTSIFNLFRKGQEVANVEAWKAGQITSNVLAGVFLAGVQVAKAFDYEIPMDEATANSIAIGVVSTVNFIITVITSKRAGVLPAKPTGEALPQLAEADTISAPSEGQVEIVDHSINK